MMNGNATEGKTTIAPEVLQSIAKLSCLSVPGVSRFYPYPTSVNRLLKKGGREGVLIQVNEDTVDVDLFVVLQNDTNIREISKNIQTAVARSISDMVGMKVGRVNIHVEDVDFPVNEEARV